MTINSKQILKCIGLALTLAASCLSLSVHAAATIIIINGDSAGVGFNDPTPVVPVGGNTGTTLGQQRLNAFQAAANIWGAQLDSAVPVRINATWDALSCTDTSAVLGSAGPIEVFRDFSGVPFAGTWYHVALANAIFGIDLDPSFDDIRARFNSNLGQAGCLTGVPFYLGLDNNHGTKIDFVTVLLHELGHGLGFSTVTNGSTGQTLAGFPALWDHFLFDNTQGLSWASMTNAQRQASAINTGNLIWSGPNVFSSAPSVLTEAPQLRISSPSSVAGVYQVGTASFGPVLSSPGVTGQLMPVVGSGNQGLACEALNASNTLAVNGNIALIDRGTCSFVLKVQNAQNAGAIGVVIANNVAGSPPPDMGGSDSTITIPSVMITQADGVTLKTALKFRSRTKSGVIANIGLSAVQLAGTDANGKARLYAPNPFVGGSSVSHWDTGMQPNQIMEPFINGDLTHSIIPPQDMTIPLMHDIGW